MENIEELIKEKAKLEGIITRRNKDDKRK